jgi:shikimate dehydrogenase
MMVKGAVLGSPISHSLSPVLHKAAFDRIGVSGSYEAIDVPSGTLKEFFARNESAFDYFSLTMPLKEEAHLLGVECDELSLRIGSINTLYKRSGRWFGTSTDGSGFVAALAADGYENVSRALILGAGGTARAVAGALDGHVETLSVMGRTSTRRDALERCVERSSFSYLPWVNDPDINSYDLVVNTTPAGAADILAENLPTEVSGLLFDVIYKPWPTVLASAWKDRSGKVINGKELLLWQGLDQLALVLPEEFDRGSLAADLREVLSQL